MQVDWFASEDHRSFEYPGNGSGALMLHGFMGTPKELRSLGRELAQEGFHWKLKLLPVLKHVIRRVKPFSRTDFNDPGVRQFFESALPELDIDDPEVQQALRKHVELPTQTIDELRRLAIESGEIASEVNVPTLVIQGTDNLTVRASDTRELVSRIGNNARLEELSGGHLLVSDQERSWQEVRTIVREFVNGGTS